MDSTFILHVIHAKIKERTSHIRYMKPIEPLVQLHFLNDIILSNFVYASNHCNFSCHVITCFRRLYCFFIVLMIIIMIL